MDKQSLMRLLIRVNRQRRNHMKPYYSEVGLTSLQISALFCISDHPGRMQKEIAEDIGVSPTVLVGILRNLEEKNLVECTRPKYNRRAISVFLTDVGMQLVDMISLVVRESDAKALNGFSPEELETLRSLLLRISDNLQQ